jgi:hypothetical protein
MDTLAQEFQRGGVESSDLSERDDLTSKSVILPMTYFTVNGIKKRWQPAVSRGAQRMLVVACIYS